MPFNPSLHHRRSIRLKGYDDCRAGAYFVTLCCECRTCRFGEVIDADLHLNAAGEMIQAVWGAIPDHYPDVGIAGFVVMPNHVHGVIVLAGAGRSGQPPGIARTGCLSLPDVVHRFKTMTTRRYADGVIPITRECVVDPPCMFMETAEEVDLRRNAVDAPNP